MSEPTKTIRWTGIPKSAVPEAVRGSAYSDFLENFVKSEHDAAELEVPEGRSIQTFQSSLCSAAKRMKEQGTFNRLGFSGSVRCRQSVGKIYVYKEIEEV